LKNDPKRVKWKILNNPNESKNKRLLELEKLTLHVEDRQRFSGFVELGGLIALAHWIKEATENRDYNTITRILACLNYDNLDLTISDLDSSTLGEQVLSLPTLGLEKIKVLVHELSTRWKKMYIEKPHTKKKKSSQKRVKFADQNQQHLRMLNKFFSDETIYELAKRLKQAKKPFEEAVQWSAPQGMITAHT